jgi:hypothetical protein
LQPAKAKKTAHPPTDIPDFNSSGRHSSAEQKNKQLTSADTDTIKNGLLLI